MNRKIIVALIIIVLIILGGLIVFSQNNIKMDTQINFLSNTSLENGDSVEFELIDAQGNPIENQNITIAFQTSEGIENYSIITDSQGRGSLVLNDQGSGSYNITLNYGGDDRHNGCSAKQSITIGYEEESDTSGDYTDYSYSTTSYDSSNDYSSSSDVSYDTSSETTYDSSQSDSEYQAGQSSDSVPDTSDGNLE